MREQHRCRPVLGAALIIAAAAAIPLVALAATAQKPGVASVPKLRPKLAAPTAAPQTAATSTPAESSLPPQPLYRLVGYVRNEALPVPPKAPGQSLPIGTTGMCKGSAGYYAATQTSAGSGSPAAAQAGSDDAAACSGWTPAPGASKASSSNGSNWVGYKGIGFGMEAFSVAPQTVVQNSASWPSCLQLEYMAHLPGLGDTGWYPAPTLVGTPGSGKYVEGIAFRLTGTCASRYVISYNCHLHGLGDQTFVSGPSFCGTRGQGRPLEAFVVYVQGIQPSTALAPSAPGKSTVAFNVSSVKDAVGPDTWFGTRGQGIQLTSLSVKPSSTGASPWPSCLNIKYMAHVSGAGDTGWYDAPASVQGRMEGVAFKLDGTCATSYTVEYQCHVQGIGDVALISGPSFCGTRGQGRRLEAVKLTVRKK